MDLIFPSSTDDEKEGNTAVQHTGRKEQRVEVEGGSYNRPPGLYKDTFRPPEGTFNCGRPFTNRTIKEGHVASKNR